MLSLTTVALTTMLKPAYSQLPGTNSCPAGVNCFTVNIAPATGQKGTFRFPKDIRWGDMITGSVIEEQKNNAGEVNKTSSKLEGAVIEIDGKQTKLSSRLISFLVPAGIASLPFLIKNSAGQVIEQGQIPVGNVSYIDTRELEPAPATKFSPEPLGQPGHVLKTAGSFDGNAANTNISLNGQSCESIAESPRENFTQVSQNATTGPANLTITENNVTEEHTINVAALNLNTNKSNLRRREEATITTTVSGLQGMPTGNDCRVEIANLSPSVVSIKGTSGNTVSRDIPQGITGDYKYTFKIVGVTQGNFALEGSLYCVPGPVLANNTVPDGPEYKAWQERYRQAIRKRLIEEGFTPDEIKDMVEDSFSGTGIIKNLWRLWKLWRAIKNARKDVGDPPDRSK